MMLPLIFYIILYRVNIFFTNRKCPIAILLKEIFILFTFCFDPL